MEENSTQKFSKELIIIVFGGSSAAPSLYTLYRLTVLQKIKMTSRTDEK